MMWAATLAKSSRPSQTRCYSTNPRYSDVKLSSQIVKATSPKENQPPTLIIHGLFGSGQNWRAISRRLSANLGCDLHLIDLRNHGESPHRKEHSYSLMASDVLQYLEDQQIQKANLIGHSMGGKVVMKVALDNEERVEKLVVADISPINYKESFQKFLDYVRMMKDLDLTKINTRKEADLALSEVLPNYGLRQFLLTNLKDASEEGGNKFKWRINLDSLGDNIGDIRDFVDTEGKQFKKKTLFLGGSESNYILPKYQPDIDRLFPNNSVHLIPGAGHWLHADKPEEFIAKTTEFLKN